MIYQQLSSRFFQTTKSRLLHNCHLNIPLSKNKNKLEGRKNRRRSRCTVAYRTSNVVWEAEHSIFNRGYIFITRQLVIADIYFANKRRQLREKSLKTVGLLDGVFSDWQWGFRKTDTENRRLFLFGPSIPWFFIAPGKTFSFFFSLSFSFSAPFSTYPGSLLGTWLSSHHAHPVVVCIKWAICAFNIRKWSYAAELIVFTCGTAISFEPLSHLLLQFSRRRSFYGEDATGIITWIDQRLILFDFTNSE